MCYMHASSFMGTSRPTSRLRTVSDFALCVPPWAWRMGPCMCARGAGGGGGGGGRLRSRRDAQRDRLRLSHKTINIYITRARSNHAPILLTPLAPGL